MDRIEISRQTLQRLPYYLNYLKKACKAGVETVSAPKIAKEMGLNEVQVRKDLAAVSTNGGKPKVGFCVGELIEVIENCLGYNNKTDAVLAGAGNLGRALLSYDDLDEYGVSIVAAFDCDKDMWGTEINGKHVFSLDKLGDLCDRLHVSIGIITVPGNAAQKVCDLMVQSGILAIWNFAPVRLSVPGHILVQNENMAASLAMLSKHLQSRTQGKGEEA